MTQQPLALSAPRPQPKPVDKRPLAERLRDSGHRPRSKTMRALMEQP